MDADKKKLWKIFGRLVAEHVWSGPRWVIFLAGFSMILTAVATAALTQWIKPVIDDIFIQHRADQLLYISIGVFFLFFIRGFFEYTSNRCTDFIAARLVKSLQSNIFRHLMGVNMDFFRRNHEGYLSSVLNNDVGFVRTMVIETMKGLFHRSLMVIFLAVTMIKSSFTMFWMTLWLLPVTGFLLVYCQKKARHVTTQLAFHISDANVFFQQIFQNMVLVKTSHTETREIDAMDRHLQSVWDQSVYFSKVQSIIHPIMDFIAGIAIACGLFFVGHQVIQGTQSVGAFFTFIMALVFIYPPIKMIVSLNTKMQEGLVATKRIYDLLETPAQSFIAFNLGRPDHQEKVTAPLDESVGSWATKDVVFDRVTFQYPSATKPVFQDFSCRFSGGKKTALVGTSGGGKTTLFYLLLRLYTPGKGEIRIGDNILNTIPLAQWLQNIAFVGQEISLFSDTVAENIAYGVSASREQIHQAASMAYADEFIESLPQGYDTIIGTRGLMLSGGQRQRLALARAFLRNSPIVLFDEATSALDGSAEKKITEATFRLMEGRTTLIIAHRFSTIEAVDTILVLDQGHVVQEGSHPQLMGEKGLYQKWARMQQI